MDVKFQLNFRIIIIIIIIKVPNFIFYFFKTQDVRAHIASHNMVTRQWPCYGMIEQQTVLCTEQGLSTYMTTTQLHNLQP